MFLPWSIFAINIVLSVYQFLLIAAVGATLAIYSRFGGEYANSIRWTRQGGYLEMCSALFNSRESIPNRVKLTMTVTIIVSLMATLLDKGAAHFIVPSERPSGMNHTVVSTAQLSPASWQNSFVGWSTTIRDGEDPVEAMALMINNTKIIPGAVRGRSYIPRVTEYHVECERSNVVLLNPALSLTEGGCSNVFVGLDGNDINIDYTRAKISLLSSNRWSIVIVAPRADLTQEKLAVLQTFGNTTCGIFESQRGTMSIWPTTVTTKCVLPSGHIAVASLSSVRFSSTVGIIDAISTFFTERDEMLRSIIDDAPSGLNMNSTLRMEVKVSSSSIDIVMCLFNELGFVQCIYTNINTFIVRQQEVNPDIAAAREGRPFSTRRTSTAITFERVPIISSGTWSISNSRLRNETSAVSHYMAALGQNFFSDYDEGQLYVLYDTSDPEKGLEVPLWLLLFMGITMTICLCLCVLTELLLDSHYTSSLYKNISIQLASRTNRPSPVLMRSRVDPVEFEGALVLPEIEDYEMNTSIDRTKTVDHLKDLIKAKKANTYSLVDADMLTLWRVSIPDADDNADDDELPILLDNISAKDRKKLKATR
ncbi:hypothetical protein BGZ81_006298 [Podila clonocystis]|nr:hypothetical protein BGZ81_006298 [Podila clonocystis]